MPAPESFVPAPEYCESAIKHLRLLGGQPSECTGKRGLSGARAALEASELVPPWAGWHSGMERVAGGCSRSGELGR